MRNFGLIFGLLAALTVAAILCIVSKGLKYGIDLSGGTILVYKVKESTRNSAGTMDELIAALQKRVNPEGVSDIPIRKVGNNRIEIILAKADKPGEVEVLKRKITDVGSLEFRILANQKHDAEAIKRALAPDGLTRTPKGYQWMRLGEIINGTNPKILDSTHFSDPAQTITPERYKGTEVILKGKDTSGREVTRTIAVKSNTERTIDLEKPHGLASISSFTINYNPSKIQPTDDAIVRDEPGPNGRVDRYILIKLDRQDVSGKYLSHAYQTQDERIQPAVGFSFDAQGARKFGNLTGQHLPEEGGQFQYRLAVILDGMVRSAPSIRSRITDSGIIEGVQPDEVPYLIEILRAGSLPATIDPTPELEEKIGPTLGKDTIDKGLRAIAVSMLVVPIFMIIYYRFAGVVSVIALILNMILLVASMAVTDSSFTLPGLAGLALTIGMAVDANVLIFERMREEQERGAGLTQTIRNGFARAWITIFDSHITIFLSGFVLWWVGTQDVKGFALTLIIGMVWNLFTAVYVSHVIFDFWHSRGWLKHISMMKIMDKTQIDFIGWRYVCIGVSSVLILIGLIATYVKSERDQLLNIDFTGGTLVTIQVNDQASDIKALTESQRSSYIRKRAEPILGSSSVESLNIGASERGQRFNIRTSDEDRKDVEAKVFETFKHILARIQITLGKPAPIPPASTPTPTADAAGKTADAAKTAPGSSNPFAGGSRYDLTVNRQLATATIETALVDALKAAGVATPERRFRILVHPRAAGTTATETLSIETDLAPEEATPLLKKVVDGIQDDPALLFERVENFGGAVAGETRNLAIIAIVMSWLIIIAFLWFRFKSVAYGVAAVLALVHDVLIALGAVALSPYKIDLPMIAAFLTLIGFSVNDTIVIFDRIREIKGKTPLLSPTVINAAINQTLSRTILTSLTALMVVVILYFFGGEGLAGFSFCLVVGFMSGVYSTVAIASPILVDWIGGGGHTAKSKAKPVTTEV